MMEKVVILKIIPCLSSLHEDRSTYPLTAIAMVGDDSHSIVAPIVFSSKKVDIPLDTWIQVTQTWKGMIEFFIS